MSATIGKRLLAVLLAMLLLASLCTISLAETAPEVRELTLEDLQAMNGGNLAYTTNDSGYITFLRGNFYDGVIKDGDDVLAALEGVGKLLGADENMGYIKGGCIVDDQQYRYYTLYQWQGDTAVDFAIVKAIVDPEGKTAALSSSLVSGAVTELDSMITPEQALTVVKEQLAAQEPDTDYTYFENDVTKTRTQKKDEDNEYVLTLAYIVYTNNPGISLADNGLAYLAHYVSATGEYLYSMPVSAIGSEDALQGNDAARTFEGKTAATYSGTVVGQSGATHEINVPVMLDESTGTYYLADIERKIAVADCWEYNFNNEHVALLSSTDNTGWDSDALIAYSNYILAYDFYNAVGWKSTDGLGTPILLLANYVDEDHNPIPNACYSGKQQGWQVFCATSKAMNAAETVDIVGHEFTHGVETASTTGILYENQYGAINESLSDIMGNLIEMLSGRTDDTTWLIGEMGGEAARNMSDPNALGQPAFIGDVYYVPDTSFPGSSNDRGGVHINNSLLAGIAPKLEKAGMTLEEQRLLWTTFICAMTPRTGYAEANLILPFAADIAGLGRHQGIIAKALDEIGMNNADPFGAPAAGQVMATMELPEDFDMGTARLLLLNLEGGHGLSFPKAGTNKIALLLPQNTYRIRFSVFDAETLSHEVAVYFFDGTDWQTDKAKAEAFELNEGETMVVPFTDAIVAPTEAK